MVGVRSEDRWEEEKGYSEKQWIKNDADGYILGARMKCK
jgi:hypothetical protein